MISSRSRITSIPVLAAGAFAASLPLSIRALAQDASPEPVAVENPFADLGLAELNLTVLGDNLGGIPESIEAGRYVLTMSGEPGPEDYLLGGMLVQLPEGVTMEDVVAQIAETEMEYPPVFYESVLAGGKLAMAGLGETSATSVVDLTPGAWLVVDLTMAREPLDFTVTGEMPTDLPTPESNVTLEMGEMYFRVAEGAFRAGDNIIHLTNAGAQPHFAEIVRVPDGTTNDNIAALITLEMGGTPEAEPVDISQAMPITFLAEQSRGVSSWAPVTMEAGTYAILCFVGEPETGMPHAMMGMHDVFVVE